MLQSQSSLAKGLISMDAIEITVNSEEVEEAKIGAVDKASARKDEGAPLSPASLLFLEPGTNCCIIAMVGCKKKLDPGLVKEGLYRNLVKHPRFSSKLVINGGKKKWIQTQVNLDKHVTVPEVDTEMESTSQFIEDYVSNLTTIPLDLSKPLWELHLLNLKTREAEAVGIWRIHHSIGDGMSLISLLFACCRKSSDPEALPTLPKQKQTDHSRNPRRFLWLFSAVWSVLKLLFNTIVDVLHFVATCIFLKDTKTPLKGSSGVEHNPKRIVYRTVSLDDIKLVKAAMGMTVNDVILGVTQAGLSRYLNRKYGEVDRGKGAKQKSNQLPRNIRLRATVLVNIRQSAGIQALADMMNKKSKAKWGNKIGFILIPITIALQNDHPLDYLRGAKATADRKKLSLEAIFTYLASKYTTKLFGSKLSGVLAYRITFNTTMSISNLAGPVEEISFFGHPIAFIAPTVYGQPQALTLHFQSYINKMSIVAAVDPNVIPDPHLLCDDLEESLKIFKHAVLTNNSAC
ncbi:O-acyltransferase WSD1-like [Durio zibethinus]|uniref:O-acyltransferase WSD1-like n=1 Tax=Durio zibethinus TaxID=66656 RepID=A0A6P6AGF8_DURZI|nr:O-acyltransferase WSD1-like [Durio zibethinus]